MSRILGNSSTCGTVVFMQANPISIRYAACGCRSHKPHCAGFFNPFDQPFEYATDALQISPEFHLPDFHLSKLNAYFGTKGRWEKSPHKPHAPECAAVDGPATGELK